MADPGFDTSVPSEFRSRLVMGDAATLLLDTLLALCREQKLLAPLGGSARTARTFSGPSVPSTGPPAVLRRRLPRRRIAKGRWLLH